jgi:iron complex transport system ATP-binding protein
MRGPIDQQRAAAEDPAVVCRGVRVWTPDGAELLAGVDWTIRRGEHWALLGPNGAGKTTLLSLLAAVRHPSAGEVRVLGGRLGRVDLRELRRRIGLVHPGLRPLPHLSAEATVLTGASGSVQPLWDRYGPQDRARATDLLELVGCGHLRARPFGSLSDGERQRVLLARALQPAPALLLLDEPASALDLPAREALLAALSALAMTAPELATVLVCHHLEELPHTTSHALLLRAGAAVAAGPVDQVLRDRPLSAAFGIDVRVGRHDGRWAARARRGQLPARGWQPAAAAPTSAAGVG